MNWLLLVYALIATAVALYYAVRLWIARKVLCDLCDVDATSWPVVRAILSKAMKEKR